MFPSHKGHKTGTAFSPIITILRKSGRKACLLACFIVSFGFLTAQDSPYQLSVGKDLSIAGGVVVGQSIDLLFLHSKNQAFSPNQIGTLSPNRIPAFDRFATQQWHPTAQKHSDWLLVGSALLPLCTLLDKPVRKDWQVIGLMGLETFALNLTLTNLTKHSAVRTRPFVYNPNAPLELKLQKDARYSFFSGHTSTVASMSMFAAQVYTDYHPRSKALPFVWGTAAALPALAAYLRVRGGKHFPSDVVAGYLVGAACGILIPRLHKK